MRQKLSKFFIGLRDRWNELNRSERIKVILSIAAVITVMGVVIFYAARPKMTSVMSKLTFMAGADGQRILSEAGIYSEFSKGELFVKQKDATSATLLLNNSDVPALNSPDTSFTDALSLISMGTTSAIQREVMINEKQNELAKSLEMYEGVVSAKVNLVLMDASNTFLRSEQNASMSVNLVTDKTISVKDGQAMARYLCKSIKGLKMEDIEITNQNYETVYSGTKLSTDGYAELYVEMEAHKKKEIEGQVKIFTASVFNEVAVLINLDINNDKVREQIKRYEDPNVDPNLAGFITNSDSSSSSVTGGETEGEPGPGSNDQTPPTYEMGNNGVTSAKTKDEKIQYIYDEIFKDTEKAIGIVDYANSSLSVRVVRNRKYYEESLPRYIESDGLPETTTWKQFQEGISEFILIPPDDDLQALSDSIKVGTGIANVSLIAYEHSVFEDRPPAAVPLQTYVVFAILTFLILLLLYGFIKKTQLDEITEIEPELTVEDLLVSSQFEEAKESDAEKLQSIAFNQESEAMKQIESFVAERPEAVAQLLRNWINEDWE